MLPLTTLPFDLGTGGVGIEIGTTSGRTPGIGPCSKSCILDLGLPPLPLLFIVALRTESVPLKLARPIPFRLLPNVPSSLIEPELRECVNGDFLTSFSGLLFRRIGASSASYRVFVCSLIVSTSSSGSVSMHYKIM